MAWRIELYDPVLHQLESFDADRISYTENGWLIVWVGDKQAYYPQWRVWRTVR